jgi:tRNA-Thr(GGU) m(6)t(6)A37 methyltransferase TsaA
MRIWLLGSMIGIMLVAAASFAQTPGPKQTNFRRKPIKICLNPVGVVKKQGEQAHLEIYPEYAPALKGLQGFSHLWVFYWFHENDTPEQRQTLQVHPRRNPANPLTGVFACRSPERPNLIGFTVCRIINVKDNLVEVAKLDARDGSPIVDLKPYIPEGDALPEAHTPDWLKDSKPSGFMVD